MHASAEFAVRNGHEDCTFFAEGLDGKEIPLSVVRQTTTEHLGDIPLL
jgi:hypothetical protein